MNNWRAVSINDIAEKITSGGTPSRRNKDYFIGDIPWVKSGEINGWYVYDSEEHINQEAIDKTSAKLFQKDTVLMAMYGQGETIGRVGMLGVPASTNQALCAISTDKDKCDPKFLMYLLKVKREEIVLLAQGAARRNLNVGKISSYKIKIPDVKTQQRISNLISAYDELIENNQKRIKILEEMAQRLYTEWFVNFKFPGYEDVQMVDSCTEFGDIPEGWEVKKLSDIGKVITGSTPSKQKPQYYGSEYMFIKTPDFNQGLFITNSDEKLSQDGFEVQKTRLLPAHTVMVTTIGTLGKVAITTEQSFTNQQINSLVLKNQEDYVFYYFFAKNLKKKLEGLGSNGATMGNVSKSKFESMKIIYPSTQLLADFFTLTSSNFLEIECLMSNNQYLVKMRDLLIENLVTGKRLLKN